MNYYKPKEDYYFHLAVFIRDDVRILLKNEKNKEVILEYILHNCLHERFKVIGTLETLEEMVDYVNKKALADSLMFLYSFEEKDAFKTSDTIFVDKTNEFRDALTNK